MLICIKNGKNVNKCHVTETTYDWIVKSLHLNFFKEIMRFDFKHILIINTWIDWYWCGKLYCKSPIRKKIRDEFLTFYVQKKKLAVNSASTASNIPSAQKSESPEVQNHKSPRAQKPKKSCPQVQNLEVLKPEMP